MKRDAWLWSAVLTGPTAWFFSMLANFALAPWVCGGGRAVLFVVAIVALAITVAAGVLAWRLWRRVGVALPAEGSGVAGHERSLALAGVGLSAMFALVIVAQFLPNFMAGGCE